MGRTADSRDGSGIGGLVVGVRRGTGAAARNDARLTASDRSHMATECQDRDQAIGEKSHPCG